MIDSLTITALKSYYNTVIIFNIPKEEVSTSAPKDKNSSMSTTTLSSLIGCHFNKTWTCCECHKFEESLLTAAKKCTHERNMQYQNTSSVAS